jgi:hypothetical protein
MPSTPHFRNLANEMQQNFVTLSIFVFSQGRTFKNLINLAELARYLNGDLYHYTDGHEKCSDYFLLFIFFVHHSPQPY